MLMPVGMWVVSGFSTWVVFTLSAQLLLQRVMTPALITKSGA